MSIEKYIIVGVILTQIVTFVYILIINEKSNSETYYIDNNSDTEFNDKDLDYRKLVVGNYCTYVLNVEFEKDGNKYYADLYLHKDFKDYRFTNHNDFKLKYFKLKGNDYGSDDSIIILFKGNKAFDVFRHFGIFYDCIFPYKKNSLFKKTMSKNLFDLIDENTKLKITGITEEEPYEVR